MTTRQHGDVLAVIPARGGSKGVPGKNLAPVGGVPLVQRAVRACLDATRVSRVVVSTDDAAIASLAENAGAEVIHRPAEISGDTASSEAAVMHAVQTLYGAKATGLDVVLLVQCTSPFLTSTEVDACVEAVMEGADSAFTAAEFHGFVWRQEDSAVGVNHDHRHRPRRQDRPKELLETGAAYAMRARGFLRAGFRFFGRIRAVETDPRRVLEIDEIADLERARSLAAVLDRNRPGITRSDVDAIVLDFDGTLTDDRVWVSADGSEHVAAHRGDGMGIAALRNAGLPVLILSSETNPVVTARAAKLRVECIHAVANKGAALAEWCRSAEVDPTRVVFVGNDINDLACMRQVGWPIAVSSAHESVREAARLVTTVPGGHGAVREVASWILGKELEG